MEKTANKQKMHGGKIALYVIAILWTVVTSINDRRLIQVPGDSIHESCIKEYRLGHTKRNIDQDQEEQVVLCI